MSISTDHSNSASPSATASALIKPEENETDQKVKKVMQSHPGKKAPKQAKYVGGALPKTARFQVIETASIEGSAEDKDQADNRI